MLVKSILCNGCLLTTRHYTNVIISPPTSPLRPRRIPDIRLLHAEGSPTMADSQSTSLANVAQSLIPESSPMNHRIFSEISEIHPRLFTRSISAPIATKTS